ARERHRVDAHPRRVRLLEGIRHRAAVSRRAAHGDRRGHQRDPARDHRQAMAQAESAAMTPLKGVRILSAEVWGAGPYGTQLLAALGAEVIKIENPAGGGDPARYVGPHRLGAADSQYFQ